MTNSPAYPPGFAPLPKEQTQTAPSDPQEEKTVAPWIDLEAETPWQQVLLMLQRHWEPFQPHLQELRLRLLLVSGTWAAFSLLLFIGHGPLVRYLQQLAPRGQQFVQLYPGELLLVSVKLSLSIGAFLTTPVALYHGLRFLLPGLNPGEKKLLLAASVLGFVLVLLGLTLGLTVLLPSALAFLLDFGAELAPYQLSIARYTDFVLFLVLTSGLACCLPLVLLMGAWLNLLSSKTLRQHWRLVVVGLFTLSALLTPSQDPFTMSLLTGVLLLLVFLSWLGLVLLKR